MEGIIQTLTKPVLLPLRSAEIVIAIPRIVTAFIIVIYFGIPNIPVGDTLAGRLSGLGLPFPFVLTWITVGIQIICGTLLFLGLKTRISAFLISMVILVGLFMGHWGSELAGLLPPLGFLWVALYSIALGSGRFGLDFLISRNYGSSSER